jgi:hypothetical protein
MWRGGGRSGARVELVTSSLENGLVRGGQVREGKGSGGGACDLTLGCRLFGWGWGRTRFLYLWMWENLDSLVWTRDSP